MDMSWFGKKKFGLAALERTVAMNNTKGVSPSREMMVTATSVTSALGIPITAVDEGRALIAAKKAAAVGFETATLQIQKKAEADIKALQRKIETTRRQAESDVVFNEARAASAKKRAEDVKTLVDLIA